jgi:hypothetical protein
MKTIISKYKIVTIHKNLLGKALHRNFLALQAECGIANREGFYHPSIQGKYPNTLFKERNFFNPLERIQLIFSVPILNN